MRTDATASAVSAVPHGGGSAKKMLPALTSLRFFAATIVVYHHIQVYFALPAPNWISIYHQGVAIFFVLSGFILTYVYPSLENWLATKRFYRARIARIWPAYLASIAFTIIVNPTLLTSSDTTTFLGRLTANILAIQSWSPAGSFFHSINGPSWSVSTEVFFYALFPLLILGFSKTWWLKLLGSFAMAALLIFVVVNYNVPGLGEAEPNAVNSFALLYIDPYARLFEFVCGMCAAWLWRRYSLLDRLGPLAATGLEALSLYFLMFNYIIAASVFWFLPAFNTTPTNIWAGQAAGAAIPAAIFMVVLASNKGFLAKQMSAVWLVVLGEISYAIYLFHYPIYQIFTAHIAASADAPNWFVLGLYVVALLSLSHMIWILVEKPFREMLMGTRGYFVPSTSAGPLSPSWKIAALDGFVCLIIVFYVLVLA